MESAKGTEDLNARFKGMRDDMEDCIQHWCYKVSEIVMRPPTRIKDVGVEHRNIETEYGPGEVWELYALCSTPTSGFKKQKLLTSGRIKSSLGMRKRKHIIQSRRNYVRKVSFRIGSRFYKEKM